MSRLKAISFETGIIERYRRRESGVEEVLIEMYLAGVSVRRAEDITIVQSKEQEKTMTNGKSIEYGLTAPGLIIV